eukprot:7636646-Ditylum_brightwellii.AAC.2
MSKDESKGESKGESKLSDDLFQLALSLPTKITQSLCVANDLQDKLEDTVSDVTAAREAEPSNINPDDLSGMPQLTAKSGANGLKKSTAIIFSSTSSMPGAYTVTLGSVTQFKGAPKGGYGPSRHRTLSADDLSGMQEVNLTSIPSKPGAYAITPDNVT